MSEPFVKCPFCAGHEAVSAKAADAIQSMIEEYQRGVIDGPLDTELWNIRNSILNHQERAAEVDPLLA
jgi:hypothetical protein